MPWQRILFLTHGMKTEPSYSASLGFGKWGIYMDRGRTRDLITSWAPGFWGCLAGRGERNKASALNAQMDSSAKWELRRADIFDSMEMLQARLHGQWVNRLHFILRLHVMKEILLSWEHSTFVPTISCLAWHVWQHKMTILTGWKTVLFLIPIFSKQCTISTVMSTVII